MPESDLIITMNKFALFLMGTLLFSMAACKYSKKSRYYKRDRYPVDHHGKNDMVAKGYHYYGNSPVYYKNKEGYYKEKYYNPKDKKYYWKNRRYYKKHNQKYKYYGRHLEALNNVQTFFPVPA